MARTAADIITESLQLFQGPSPGEILGRGIASAGSGLARGIEQLGQRLEIQKERAKEERDGRLIEGLVKSPSTEFSDLLAALGVMESDTGRRTLANVIQTKQQSKELQLSERRTAASEGHLGLARAAETRAAGVSTARIGLLDLQAKVEKQELTQETARAQALEELLRAEVSPERLDELLPILGLRPTTATSAEGFLKGLPSDAKEAWVEVAGLMGLRDPNKIPEEKRKQAAKDVAKVMSEKRQAELFKTIQTTPGSPGRAEEFATRARLSLQNAVVLDQLKSPDPFDALRALAPFVSLLTDPTIREVASTQVREALGSKDQQKAQLARAEIVQALAQAAFDEGDVATAEILLRTLAITKEK